jgi:hypothetical protein
VRLSEFSDAALDALRSAATSVSDLATPRIRLGVTGLARSGKTVFITALVRALTEGGASPALPTSALEGFRATLDPQPDDDVPRFTYEEHLARLAADPPAWPEGTRRISELRLTLAWQGRSWPRRQIGLARRLHLDIIDYPGEWLIDLALLDLSFAEWSRQRVAEARRPSRSAAAKAWLAFAAGLSPGETGDEQAAIQGAKLYTQYLHAVRAAEEGAAPIGPGRFLMPGDLAGSPLLTFFPLEGSATPPARASADGVRNGTLGELLARRFESYKAQVVRPFFDRHFRRLDRQVVLVDVLGALNRGPQDLRDLELAMEGVLATMRPGTGSWLASLLGRRSGRVLFAASKADHLNRANHTRLEAILAAIVERARTRASASGAGIATGAIAALRATEEVVTERGGSGLACVRGVPLQGERVGRTRFDGVRPAVVFPGDLPEDPLDAFDVERLAPGTIAFPRFRPPRLAAPGGGGAAPWPHIGLDAALRFLLADHLA